MGMPFRVSLRTTALHPIRLREASFPVTAATDKQTDNPQMCSGVQMELSFPLPKYYRCQPPAEDAKKSRTASLSLQINYVKRLLYLTSNLLHNYNLWYSNMLRRWGSWSLILSLIYRISSQDCQIIKMENLIITGHWSKYTEAFGGNFAQKQINAVSILPKNLKIPKEKQYKQGPEVTHWRNSIQCH